MLPSHERFHINVILRLLVPIDPFTVVRLVTWPLNGSEAGGIGTGSLLLLCKSTCSTPNQVYLHGKSREGCIKGRSPPALLLFKGQVTKQTTVKWSTVIINVIRGSCRTYKNSVRKSVGEYNGTKTGQGQKSEV